MVGRTLWVIAEGYIPSRSVDPTDRALVSHEAACILNAGDENAQVEITLYFATGSLPVLTAARSRPGGPCTCGSTTLMIPSRCRATPITPP